MPDPTVAGSEQTLPITAVILTYNERQHLSRCIKSIGGLVKEFVVVDSFSEDNTRSIARDYGARVVTHEYENHPDQWRWVLESLDFDTNWLFAVDADFIVEDALTKEVVSLFKDGIADDVTGIEIRHRQKFGGRLLRFGGINPRYWLRVFKRSAVTVDPCDRVDVHFLVEGETERTRSGVVEDNINDRDYLAWIEKQIAFAEAKAAEELAVKRGDCKPTIREKAYSARWTWAGLEKSVWPHLPRYWRAVALFGLRYFVMGGFLDGREGLKYHVSQSLLFRLMVDSKVARLEADEEDTYAESPLA